MKSIETKFEGAQIIAPVDQTDIYSIRAEVTYRWLAENGFYEAVAVNMVFFDMSLSADEIASMAIEKANEHIERIAALIA